ncbi:MAG: dihydrolipoyl dehydrogenase [Rhodocyclaceae bacterium]|nr:MAG: dihydrolipoyl dehydrogenase [Rhodocyclaceae bacterium]
MAQIHEIAVPEVGSKEALAVAEILVKPGDLVWADDPLVTVESGKAAVDVVAPVDGTVTEIRVAIGDNVTPGRVVVVMAASQEQRPKRHKTTPAPASAPRHFSLFAAFSAASQAEVPPPETSCDLLVLGAGPGGYSAAFRAADLGLDTILVERYPTMGGVCLNVGCIPSKALLHLTIAMEEAGGMAAAGIAFAPPHIDIDKLRAHKARVVGKLTGGLAGMAQARKVRTLFGTGRFRDAHSIEVADDVGREARGARQVIRFNKCIIAVGSQPVHLPFLPKDERIVDSTGALELRSLPKRMLVIGGGIIGLEMATVYSALGARIDVVEMQDVLMPGPDRNLVKIWEEQNRHRFDNIMLRTRTVAAHVADDGVWVRFEGEMAPAEAQCYDMILQSVGRKPNGLRIDAHSAGISVSEAGFIPVNKQMATNVPHIFAIGDVVGMPMLAHKAVHQAHVAAESAAGMKASHDSSLIPGVAYTHPEIAWVGLSEDAARQTRVEVDIAKFPWAASGRAIANGADYGMTKLVFDRANGKLLGGAIVGPGAGDMIGEITLAISQECDAAAIGSAIHHPHPTLGETIGMAAHLAIGSCTDLPALKRRQG